MILSTLAPAKINLFLHVLGKRPDGYHNLSSLITFADIGDRITVSESTHTNLTIVGPYAAALKRNTDIKQNIILKATSALKTLAGKPLPEVSIRLEKFLPIGAGIGGGSADAAATIRLLIDFWKLSITKGELLSFCLSLGADVPVCFYGKTALVSGIGEVIEAATELPALSVVLVNPNRELSTKAVFASRIEQPRGLERSAAWPIDPKDLNGWKQFLKDQRNDLEATSIQLEPTITSILELIAKTDRCIFARMSGSGATCFGIFENLAQAEKAALTIKRLRPQWWVRSAELLNEARPIEDLSE